MREVLFKFADEYILLKVNGNSVWLGSTKYGAQFATIEGLKLNYNGVIKEFPDLKDSKDWRIEAIKRFKNKIKSFISEREVADYIIDDLRKFGYVPIYIQEAGKRRIKL